MAGIGLVLVVGSYGTARLTNGPSTPAELENKALQALSQNDVDKFAAWLDPSQPELKQPAVLEAFRESLNDSVKRRYELAIKSASQIAEKDRKSSGLTSGGIVQFTKKSGWRGPKWSLKVTPAQLEIGKKSDLAIVTSIGSLKDTDGRFSMLWPSTYNYESQITNAYAAETVKGSVDLTSGRERNVDVVGMMKSRLTVRTPQPKDAAVTLNGKPFDASKETTISPAPEEAQFQVKGTVLGLPLEGSMTLNVKQSSVADLSGVLSAGIAKVAADLVYDANLAWSKAFNEGDPNQLKGIKPDSPYFKAVAGSMTKPADNKYTLLKIGVDPKSAKIKGNEFTIQATTLFATEKSLSFFSSELTTKSSWTYTIQKVPDKNEWWIASRENAYYFGNDALSQPEAVVKSNADAPAR
ncbi:hypothetical protein ACFFNY_20290 [Paenibacillus hodogayensis]|uniref:NTF2-like N-terminal transpeptidase domain-containing protein n=1 Tax=Paenibacillus hodogayensis TaxID=279208 RepID=A0ABV5W048_9BACL